MSPRFIEIIIHNYICISPPPSTSTLPLPWDMNTVVFFPLSWNTITHSQEHKDHFKSAAPISLRAVENYLFELFHVIIFNTMSLCVNGR